MLEVPVLPSNCQTLPLLPRCRVVEVRAWRKVPSCESLVPRAIRHSLRGLEDGWCRNATRLEPSQDIMQRLSSCSRGSVRKRLVQRSERLQVRWQALHA